MRGASRRRRRDAKSAAKAPADFIEPDVDAAKAAADLFEPDVDDVDDVTSHGNPALRVVG
jgi:hypothetical protein